MLQSSCKRASRIAVSEGRSLPVHVEVLPRSTVLRRQSVLFGTLNFLCGIEPSAALAREDGKFRSTMKKTKCSRAAPTTWTKGDKIPVAPKPCTNVATCHQNGKPIEVPTNGPTAFFRPLLTHVSCNADVILGRGPGVRDLPGNVRYRAIVWEHREAYSVAHKYEKQKVATSIVKLIHSSVPPGRFLCPNPGEETYTVIEDKRAVEKTCQLLRERHLKKPSKADLESAGIALPLPQTRFAAGLCKVPPKTPARIPIKRAAKIDSKWKITTSKVKSSPRGGPKGSHKKKSPVPKSPARRKLSLPLRKKKGTTKPVQVSSTAVGQTDTATQPDPFDVTAAKTTPQPVTPEETFFKFASVPESPSEKGNLSDALFQAFTGPGEFHGRKGCYLWPDTDDDFDEELEDFSDLVSLPMRATSMGSFVSQTKMLQRESPRGVDFIPVPTVLKPGESLGWEGLAETSIDEPVKPEIFEAAWNDKNDSIAASTTRKLSI